MNLIASTPEEAGNTLAECIAKEINQDRKVLWFISGGSSIPIAQHAARILDKQSVGRLRILLIDEKFKDKDQPVTNWSELTACDVVLCKTAPRILKEGQSIEDSTSLFIEDIVKDLEWADYTIGQFGIGEGFHTGGIESYSDAITDKSLAVHYERDEFHHITVTTKLLSLLDVAFVNSFGESKQELVRHFYKSAASVPEEPTQILKQARSLIVVTDIDYSS